MNVKVVNCCHDDGYIQDKPMLREAGRRSTHLAGLQINIIIREVLRARQPQTGPASHVNVVEDGWSDAFQNAQVFLLEILRPITILRD